MINVFMSIKIKWTWRPSFFIVIVVFLLNTFVVWYQQLSWLIYNKSIIITRKRKTHLIESSCSLSEALLPCCLFLSSHCPCPLLSTGWSLSSLFSLPSSSSSPSSSNYHWLHYSHYIIIIIFQNIIMIYFFQFHWELQKPRLERAGKGF